MNMRSYMVLLIALTALAATAYGQPPCAAAKLSDRQVKNIVDSERAKRTDLPPRFPEFRWAVRRQGCHYVYTETGVPETFHSRQTFKLNQHGAIVDVQTGNSDVSGLKCPEKVFTESELTEIVKKERAKRKDLPAPFPNYRTRVDRQRCLYLYFEYAVPESRGNHHTFIIDAFGEVMEFFRGKAY
jgi:hypothetical protein